MADTQTTAPSKELTYVRNVWDSMKGRSPIYRFLLSEVQILSASEAGTITARLTVKPEHLNSKGTLHGTVSACLVDWAGGLAIAAKSMEKSGVSTDIHTTFVSTAKEGDDLEVQARATKVGGTLAFTTVEVSKIGEDGKSVVVSTGSHTKYVKK